MLFSTYLTDVIGMKLPEFAVRNLDKQQESGELAANALNSDKKSVVQGYLSYLQYIAGVRR